MLEATLLFGGMELHDQQSDLCLDVDNMSYEVLNCETPCFQFIRQISDVLLKALTAGYCIWQPTLVQLLVFNCKADFG
jgi:hypothetical protein